MRAAPSPARATAWRSPARRCSALPDDRRTQLVDAARARAGALDELAANLPRLPDRLRRARAARREGRRHRPCARQRAGRRCQRRHAVLGRGRAAVDREPSARRRAGRPSRSRRWSAGCRRSSRRRAPWPTPWSSLSCSTGIAGCCRSAISSPRTASTRVATTCSPRRPGSRASSPSPRATSRPATGSGWAAR